jgi:hypothetical protein
MVATLRHEKKTIKTLSVLGRLVAGAGFERRETSGTKTQRIISLRPFKLPLASP